MHDLLNLVTGLATCFVVVLLTNAEFYLALRRFSCVACYFLSGVTPSHLLIYSAAMVSYTGIYAGPLSWDLFSTSLGLSIMVYLLIFTASELKYFSLPNDRLEQFEAHFINFTLILERNSDDILVSAQHMRPYEFKLVYFVGMERPPQVL